MKTHTFKLLHFPLIGAILFSACKNDDFTEAPTTTETPATKEPCEIRIPNLIVYSEYRPKNIDPMPEKFIKFSFSKGKIVDDNSQEWDIAFKNATIIVNGGEKNNDSVQRTGQAGVTIESEPFERVKNIPEDALFKQDTEKEYAIEPNYKGGKSWWSYHRENHTVKPIPGRTLIFRTHDRKYAKMQIISYYKDAPKNPSRENPNNGYYTFRYVYQPNRDAKKFECTQEKTENKPRGCRHEI